MYFECEKKMFFFEFTLSFGFLQLSFPYHIFQVLIHDQLLVYLRLFERYFDQESLLSDRY